MKFIKILVKIKNQNGWIMLRMIFLATSFCYARYRKAMEEMTVFSVKDCLVLPGLGCKYFNSSRIEEDEPIYNYDDNYMRGFVRQPIKG